MQIKVGDNLTWNNPDREKLRVKQLFLNYAIVVNSAGTESILEMERIKHLIAYNKLIHTRSKRHAR